MEYNGQLFFYSLQVILASGYYAVFRVKLMAKELEGIHDGAVQITTDYEVNLLYIHGCSPNDMFSSWEWTDCSTGETLRLEGTSGGQVLCKLSLHQTTVVPLMLCLLWMKEECLLLCFSSGFQKYLFTSHLMLWGMDSSMTWYILKASVHGSFGVMHADNVLFGTLSVTDTELSFQSFLSKVNVKIVLEKLQFAEN